ncbi:hypothetical protein ACIGXM_14545 [Kitasatospora sp. NPDC052896]|uniref:hypothetical protein n=1 Tax=Kitasatospora sp. NPDC052896 TaxID=3364061 RepID=UPI0037C59D4F
MTYVDPVDFPAKPRRKQFAAVPVEERVPFVSNEPNLPVVRPDGRTVKPHRNTNPPGANTPVRDFRLADKASIDDMRKSMPRNTRATPDDPYVHGKGAKPSKDRSAPRGSVRPKSVEIAYARGAGLTAKKTMTVQRRREIEQSSANAHVETLRERDRKAQEKAAATRSNAKERLCDAIGREREALTRGDKSAAEQARADIRKFRKLSKGGK